MAMKNAVLFSCFFAVGFHCKALQALHWLKSYYYPNRHLETIDRHVIIKISGQTLLNLI